MLISTTTGQYNDNTDVDLFQYFTRAAGSSEMRLKKIDVSIVFIANDVIVAMATLYRNADNVTSLFDAVRQ